jgi:hypothetical protein
MAKDALSLLSNLQKAHDYFGKAKDLHDKVGKVRKAADLDYKDRARLVEGLKDLAGLKDKDVKKLISVLDKRAKAAEETAKAKFPDVKSPTGNPWVRWFKALDKHGEGSKEADKAQEGYRKALIEYDYLLRERSSYCDLIVKLSGKQVKTYTSLAGIAATTESILETLLKLPEAKGVSHHASCFAMYVKFQGVGPAAKRIVKGHQKIIASARAHKAVVERLKKENDLWVADANRAAMSKMLKSALSAMGYKG